MPSTSLATATLETLINELLSKDPDSASRLAALNGARLSVFITQLPFGVTLAVSSQQVDVLVEPDNFATTCEHLGERHCCLQTSMDVLSELREPSQLTGLIKQEKLVIEGELNVAQQVSELFNNLQIDWEEQLATLTGDVVAHQAFSFLNLAQAKLQKTAAKLEKRLANFALEERPIAAHRIAVMHFSDQVADLRDDVARFEARLSKLEQH